MLSLVLLGCLDGFHGDYILQVNAKIIEENVSTGIFQECDSLLESVLCAFRAEIPLQARHLN